MAQGEKHDIDLGSGRGMDDPQQYQPESSVDFKHPPLSQTKTSLRNLKSKDSEGRSISSLPPPPPPHPTPRKWHHQDLKEQAPRRLGCPVSLVDKDKPKRRPYTGEAGQRGVYSGTKNW